MSKRIAAVLASAALLLPSLSGCSQTKNYLTVGISACSQVFNPLFASSEGDLAVVDLLFDNLLTAERGGQIVFDGIEGENITYQGEEYSYSGPVDVGVEDDEENGTTTVALTLRENMTFSDGKPVTADDLLFTYYVLCDSAYEGYSQVKDLNIVGLKNYQTQTPVSIYTKYQKEAANIYKGGWPEEIGTDLTDPDTWFWTNLKDNWQKDIQENIAYCVNKYRGFSEEYIGFAPSSVARSEGLQTALSMVIWGFATVEDGTLTTSVSQKTYNLTESQYPTDVDFFEEAFAKYEGDVVTYAKEESANTTDILQVTKDAYVQQWGPQDPSVSDVDCSYISGIQRLGDHSISITFSSLEKQELYTLLDVYIAPLHYYGDATLFNADQRQYGFVRNELESLHKNDTTPLGSGAYTLVSYENSTAELTANTTYWRGVPAITSLHLAEVSEIDRINDVANGALDITTVSGADNALAEITTHNIAEKLSGNVITTITTAADSLEYIGLNTKALAIGDADSSASLYLKNALYTLLEAGREMAVSSVFGQRGAMLTQPVSFDSALINCFDSQSSPSNTTNRTESSTESGSADTTSKTPLETALSYLLLAEYTVNEENMITAAPKNGRTSFSAVCLADSTDSPSPARRLLEQLKADMDTLGLTLTITTVDSQENLDKALAGGKYHIFADILTADESLELNTRFGSEGKENYFFYKNELLDETLEVADTFWDPLEALPAYRKALEIIATADIVVPVCQTHNAILFNTERMENSSLSDVLTRHWGWADAVSTMLLT